MMKSAQGDKDSPTPEFLDKYKKGTRKSVEKLLARIFKTKLLIITLGIEMDAKHVLAIPVSIVVVSVTLVISKREFFVKTEVTIYTNF